MKNLPDKIYLNFGEITKEEFETYDYNEFCKLGEYAVTFYEDRVFDTDIEYVRKDAFIEKAVKYFHRDLEDTKVIDDYRNILVPGIQASYTSVEEFIEDFKKYMEI